MILQQRFTKRLELSRLHLAQAQPLVGGEEGNNDSAKYPEAHLWSSGGNWSLTPIHHREVKKVREVSAVTNALSRRELRVVCTSAFQSTPRVLVPVDVARWIRHSQRLSLIHI
eukprot:859632-Amphidinium_carterae.1